MAIFAGRSFKMANANDEKILILKKQIAEKKKTITNKRFVPITNCLLDIDNEKNNINVLTKDRITFLMVKLNVYRMSLKDLGLDEESLKVSGYTFTDWITDLKSRFDILTQKEEETKLKALENKLEELLSNEKRVELELGNIENLLK